LLTDDAATIMRNIVGGHHERGDGSGYPLGLARDGIPIEARIVAVADAYDALTSKRVYKQAWSHERAVEQLQREAAREKLDPDCVRALLRDPQALAEIRGRFPDQG
jgi:HD-GYP domain-containing protein (c-di-GMP phosphodiesterase class II)